MTPNVAIIFDMDGVIVDTNPYHKIALRQFCEKHSIHLSDDELINRIYGRPNKEWIVNLFRREMSPSDLSAYGEEKEKIFRDLYEKDLRPLNGLKEFLDQLVGLGIPTAIGTSAPRSNVDFVLRRTGLEKYFNVVLDESHVGRGKPDPEIYLKVAAAVNFPPGHCIVFEDSFSGVASAQAAGTKVVGVATTHTREELSHTEYVITDFAGLDPKLLIERLYP